MVDVGGELAPFIMLLHPGAPVAELPGGISDTLFSENVRFILRNDEMVGRAHDGGRLTRVDACLRTPAEFPVVVVVVGVVG